MNFPPLTGERNAKHQIEQYPITQQHARTSQTSMTRNGRSDRVRTSFTVPQLTYLEAAYSLYQPQMTGSRTGSTIKRQIAQRLGVHFKTVNYWFGHRRQRELKQKQKRWVGVANEVHWVEFFMDMSSLQQSECGAVDILRQMQRHRCVQTPTSAISGSGGNEDNNSGNGSGSGSGSDSDSGSDSEHGNGNENGNGNGGDSNTKDARTDSDSSRDSISGDSDTEFTPRNRPLIYTHPSAMC